VFSPLAHLPPNRIGDHDEQLSESTPPGEKRTSIMTRYLTGIAVAILSGCAGIWLMLSPFALRTQPTGHSWTTATTVDFYTGLSVIVVALLTLLAWALACRARLRADGVLSARPTPEQYAQPPLKRLDSPDGPPNAQELHALLVPLVDALAADTGHTRPAEPDTAHTWVAEHDSGYTWPTEPNTGYTRAVEPEEFAHYETPQALIPPPGVPPPPGAQPPPPPGIPPPPEAGGNYYIEEQR
jgi:hypothetical protein